MNKDLRLKIVSVVKEVMGIDIESMDHTRKIQTISEWDSFNNLMLISRFQQEFSVEFTAHEIEATQTIQDLFNLIQKKAGS